MPSRSTETDIVNAALSQLAKHPLISLDSDSSTTAEHSRRLYPIARDALIESFPWSFAERQATLTLSGDTPLFGFDYAFVLPVDCLRVNSLKPVVDGAIPPAYRIVGRLLHCDDDEVLIRYTSQVTDTYQFSSLFVRALIFTLASDLVGPLANGDMGLSQKFAAQANNITATAGFKDAENQDDKESGEPVIGRDSSIVQARYQRTV